MRTYLVHTQKVKHMHYSWYKYWWMSLTCKSLTTFNIHLSRFRMKKLNLIQENKLFNAFLICCSSEKMVYDFGILINSNRCKIIPATADGLSNVRNKEKHKVTHYTNFKLVKVTHFKYILKLMRTYFRYINVLWNIAQVFIYDCDLFCKLFSIWLWLLLFRLINVPWNILTQIVLLFEP